MPRFSSLRSCYLAERKKLTDRRLARAGLEKSESAEHLGQRCFSLVCASPFCRVWQALRRDAAAGCITPLHFLSRKCWLEAGSVEEARAVGCGLAIQLANQKYIVRVARKVRGSAG